MTVKTETQNYAVNKANLPYYLRYPTPRISREETHRRSSLVLNVSDFETNYPTYVSDIAYRMTSSDKFDKECYKRRMCLERLRKNK